MKTIPETSDIFEQVWNHAQSFRKPQHTQTHNQMQMQPEVEEETKQQVPIITIIDKQTEIHPKQKVLDLTLPANKSILASTMEVELVLIEIPVGKTLFYKAIELMKFKDTIDETI